MLLNEKLKKDYGAIEYNQISEGYHNVEAKHIDWNELLGLAKSGERVVSERLRFVTDVEYPMYDLSYWHVRIKGVRYRVLNSPFEQVGKRGGIKRNIYRIVKEEGQGVFIKDLFDSLSTIC